MKGNNFFLDTNIFVYAFDPDHQAKRTKAIQLIKQALDQQKGILSTQVISEFFNVVLRKIKPPMRSEDCISLLEKMFLPLCEVIVSPETIKQALIIEQETQYSYYDSLIVASAIEGHCHILYSEDFQDGQVIRNLKIANPF